MVAAISLNAGVDIVERKADARYGAADPGIELADPASGREIEIGIADALGLDVTLALGHDFNVASRGLGSRPCEDSDSETAANGRDEKSTVHRHGMSPCFDSPRGRETMTPIAAANTAPSTASVP